jgi:hypothetical protein
VGLGVGSGVGVGKYVVGGGVGAAVGLGDGVGSGVGVGKNVVGTGVETGVGVGGGGVVGDTDALALTDCKNGAANAVPIRNLMNRRRDAGILDRSASNFSGPLSVAMFFSFVWNTPHPDQTFPGGELEKLHNLLPR